ncbi:unnamed protein product [Mytilus coruscus]|uniref:TRIM2_3 n=1 Tax=Mytilus coruscus TaxID=42192 RepID=A0A6J8DHB5_MYTCO|nr:unnamed protein product [Mytilus coruscus]
MVPITYVPIFDDVRLTIRQTVKTKRSDVTGCCLLPDGRMFFSCYDSGQITVTKTNGTLDFTLQQGVCTSHIHFIEESQKLFVTTGCYNIYIQNIDMKKRKTEYSINVGSENYGIVHKDGKLFYNGGSCGLCVVNLDNNSVTQLVNGPLSEYSSIAIWSDNLYFINNDDSVTCCDLQGGIKWKFKNKSFLQTARSITVHNYGRVYVSGNKFHNVVVISPDGNTLRVLLSKNDGLYNPQSLCFDRKNNKLLVANKQYDAILCDVSK